MKLTIPAIRMALLAVFASSCVTPDQVKRDQYFVEGERLYELYCANCHQSDGLGMLNLYPPITKTGVKGRFIQIVKHGMEGEILVDGRVFDRPMPANPTLTDLEIAEITTFVYNKWGDETVYTPIDSVKKALRLFPATDLRK